MLTTSSFSTLTTMTPLVLRPAFLMLCISTRIILPELVRAIKSIVSSTITTLIRSLVFSVSFIQITPLPPLLCNLYSPAFVRFPIPFALMLKISCSSFSITTAPTNSSFFSLNLIAVTPRLTRPISRTLASGNLIHIPFLVTAKSILPCVLTLSSFSRFSSSKFSIS